MKTPALHFGQNCAFLVIFSFVRYPMAPVLPPIPLIPEISSIASSASFASPDSIFSTTSGGNSNPMLSPIVMCPCLSIIAHMCWFMYPVIVCSSLISPASIPTPRSAPVFLSASSPRLIAPRMVSSIPIGWGFVLTSTASMDTLSKKLLKHVLLYLF